MLSILLRNGECRASYERLRISAIMRMQPARHEGHACCLDKVEKLAIQSVRQHTRHSCRAGCIVFSENSQVHSPNPH